MTLAPGTRLGAYEVLASIGRGGMGEVYRARDTKLGREVAIKVLPEAFAADPDRRLRLAREARVLATVNHPNIAAIYGLEDGATGQALVLELVEGPTLADRIAQARSGGRDAAGLPLDEALSIAGQIALALEAAHELGIVHRDLKPANVKLRPDGAVKVLDFGLAKLAAADGYLERAAGAATESPTMTSPALLTERGMILGTAAYMSPEQARGRSADKRSDVWAFGCVLYEMLTGGRAFDGEEIADTLAAVMRAEPDWSALPPATPAPIRRLLERSLRKDPRQRLPEIGSARLEIADAQAASPQPPPSSRPAANAPFGSRRRRNAVMAAALFAAVLFGVGIARLSVPAPSPAEELHLEIATPPTTDPVGFAISPDGSSVVYVASADHRAQLWLRSLETGAVRPLPKTDGAAHPFWSPDSRSVGFFVGNELQRLDFDGGSPRAIARAPVGGGATWSNEGVIVFTPASDLPLSRVSADGGEVVSLPFEPPLEAGQIFPQFLPDGRSFLYFVKDPGVRGVYLGALDEPARTRLLETDTGAVYASGELLYGRAGTLYAHAFDPIERRAVGAPRVVAEGLAADAKGVPALSASIDGSIVYRTGSGRQERRLMWVDRSGSESGDPFALDLASPRNVALSPDGDRVALNRMVDGNTDVWLFELQRRLFTRLTFDPGLELRPVWSPDGRRVLYTAGVGRAEAEVGAPRPAGFGIFEQAVDGPGEERPLTGAERGFIAADWSRGDWILCYDVEHFQEEADLVALPRGGGTPVPIARTRFEELPGQFSPDQRWVAYASKESGAFEIFVQRFPEPGHRLQVSTGGGVQPRFRRDGRELYYLAPDSRLMAVALREGPDGETLEAASPVPLFTASVTPMAGGHFSEYDVAPDGERFLLNALGEQASPPLQVVLHRSPSRP